MAYMEATAALNGNDAQSATLVTWGNSYLQQAFDAGRFFPERSCFTFTHAIQFVDPESGTTLAHGPAEWFDWLVRNGCTGLSMFHVDPGERSGLRPHQTAGMVGGGWTTLIATLHGDLQHVWYNSQSVTHPDDPDDLIWSSSFRRVAIEAAGTNQVPLSVAHQREKLRAALIDIDAFAAQEKVDVWPAYFQKALRLLDDGDPLAASHHRDVFPATGYTLAAKQLLAASANAFVFGGMGSWNDLGFEARHDDLSAELYACIMNGVAAAINAYRA